MTDILSGKVIAVTGASSGIGRAIAIAAARHGARAVLVGDITDRPLEGGEATIAEIAALGAAARFVSTDVTKRAQVDAFVDAAFDLGGLDAMVCNAGITVASDDENVSEADFRRLLAVNVEGVLLSAQAAARQMKAVGKAGSIVLMGSMGGIVGAGFTVGYSTTKGGVVLMARALADALGPSGIRVNAVCPGTIDTHLLRTTPEIARATDGLRQRAPLRRLGAPSEVGDAVAFLASDLSSYVTGSSLVVDGGLTAVI